MFHSNIIFSTHKKSKKILGKRLWRKIQLLIPITLFVNILELLSVLILFPLIQLLLNPEIFKTNEVLRNIFDFINVPSEREAILLSFILLFFIFLGKNILFYFVMKKQSKIQFHIATEAVLFRFENYLKENHSFHEQNNIALLLRNVTQIPYEFVSFILIPYINVINELVILSIISTVIFLFDPILFCSIALFATPTAIIYNKYYKKRLAKISEQRDRYSAEQYKMALDSLKNFTEIKIFQKISFFVPKFRNVTQEFEGTMAQSNLLNIFSGKIIETIAITSLVLVVFVGYLLKMELSILLNFLILFAVIAFRILPSLNKLVLSVNYIKGSIHVLDHLKFESKINSDNFEKSSGHSLHFNSIVEIKSIEFAYSLKSDSIFKNLNLSIQKGDRIGIIGESGSGKSTLLSILLQFIKQDNGEILVDGQKINESNILEWYDIISYVPQSVQLISGTVAQNIAFGIEEEKIDYKKIHSIIKALNLNTFIESLPQGVRSGLGENNTAISGGQKQRIGIARALYYNRQILILDEATSALDSVTEQAVINELCNIKDLTILFVTHRAKALTHFNKIYQLESGTLTLQRN